MRELVPPPVNVDLKFPSPDKSGRSGDLVFAKVEKLIEQGGNLRVREVQTYVYREDGAPSPMPEPAAEAPDEVLGVSVSATDEERS